MIPAPSALRRRAVRAGLLGALALLPAGLLAVPAQADSGAPTLHAEVTVSPPPAPTQPLVCDYNRINCGTITIVSSLTDLDTAIPVGSYAGLYGTVRVRRVYGCENARGRRLHRYDSAVVQDASVNTRRGIPVTRHDGDSTLVLTDYAFLDDAQPGTCPAGTTPHLYRIAASRIQLQLQVQSDPENTFGYRVPGTYSWSGSVATQPPPPAR